MEVWALGLFFSCVIFFLLFSSSSFLLVLTSLLFYVFFLLVGHWSNLCKEYFALHPLIVVMSATQQSQPFGGPPGPPSAPPMNIVQRLATVNEQTWLSMGNVYFACPYLSMPNSTLTSYITSYHRNACWVDEWQWSGDEMLWKRFTTQPIFNPGLVAYCLFMSSMRTISKSTHRPESL